MAEVTLEYIGRALDRLTTEVTSMRDDITVLAATSVRLEGSQIALLREIRAMHSQHSRLANRVRALEAEDRP